MRTAVSQEQAASGDGCGWVTWIWNFDWSFAATNASTFVASTDRGITCRKDGKYSSITTSHN
jgi:hypothetical protein